MMFVDDFRVIQKTDLDCDLHLSIYLSGKNSLHTNVNTISDRVTWYRYITLHSKHRAKTILNGNSRTKLHRLILSRALESFLEIFVISLI